MHIVKCIYCQGEIDKDKIKYQKISPRHYAHLTCNAIKVNEDTAAFQTIILYCHNIFGDDGDYSRIGGQIKKYIKEGKTYNGIYLTLKYWFEVRKGNISKSNGAIGIVPYIYEEARKYWKQMEPKRVPKMEEEIVLLKPKKRQSLLERMGGLDG